MKPYLQIFEIPLEPADSSRDGILFEKGVDIWCGKMIILND
jgi:hypothetical protein